MFVLYSTSEYPGGGKAVPSYSGPPIQTRVKRPAIEGSSSQALATSVSPPPQTTYSGVSVSVRNASAMILRAPGESTGTSGSVIPVSAPGSTGIRSCIPSNDTTSVALRQASSTELTERSKEVRSVRCDPMTAAISVEPHNR